MTEESTEETAVAVSDHPRQADPLAFLLECDGGAAVNELQDAIPVISQAVQATGKTGKITVEITMSAHKRVVGMVTVGAKVKLKVPEQDRSERPYFIGEGGVLSLDHPGQITFPDAVMRGEQP